MFDKHFIEELARQLAPRVAELIRSHLTAKIAPRYLSVEQAAEYLGTTKDSVRGMLRAKRFPLSKIGAKLFIDVREIDRAMHESATSL